MLAGDNNYGNPETDAVRRDITINGLFYDISSYSIIDYVGGLEDLSQGIIRVIGDPEIRFREDPIRIIRAVRHAGRTGFDIEKNTYEKIISLAQIVRLCPSARIIEELLKDLRGGYSCPILMLLYQTGVLHYLLPFVVVELEAGGGNLEKLKESLIKIDEYIRAGLELPASVIFLSLLIGKSQNVFKSSPEFESLKIFFKAAPRHTIIDSSNELHGDKIGKVSIVEEAEIDAEHIKAELEKLIERTFKSAGVYRRDRELMVKLLKTRLELIENFASAAEVPTVPKSSSFREAVILLDLTAHDELSNSAAQYWTRYLTANPKRVEVERTKSRKPRRRKAR
jgi:tRNA nucleotidyltransferase/poly(A) polymerase